MCQNLYLCIAGTDDYISDGPRHDSKWQQHLHADCERHIFHGRGAAAVLQPSCHCQRLCAVHNLWRLAPVSERICNSESSLHPWILTFTCHSTLPPLPNGAVCCHDFRSSPQYIISYAPVSQDFHLSHFAMSVVLTVLCSVVNLACESISMV